MKGLSRGARMVKNIATILSKEKVNGGSAYIKMHGINNKTTTCGTHMWREIFAALQNCVFSKRTR
jgi:hypothetical protein